MISEYYDDEELIDELRVFLGDNINYNALLSTVKEVDDNTFELKCKGRTFQFDKLHCGVEEIE